jgi:hypothetical protein
MHYFEKLINGLKQDDSQLIFLMPKPEASQNMGIWLT